MNDPPKPDKPGAPPAAPTYGERAVAPAPTATLSGPTLVDARSLSFQQQRSGVLSGPLGLSMAGLTASGQQVIMGAVQADATGALSLGAPRTDVGWDKTAGADSTAALAVAAGARLQVSSHGSHSTHRVHTRQLILQGTPVAACERDDGTVVFLRDTALPLFLDAGQLLHQAWQSGRRAVAVGPHSQRWLRISYPRPWPERAPPPQVWVSVVADDASAHRGPVAAWTGPAASPAVARFGADVYVRNRGADTWTGYVTWTAIA